MCANYTPSRNEQLEHHFFVAAPDASYKSESFPGYMAPIIRRADRAAEDSGRTCALGMFGIVPHWTKDEKFARHTYNARTETVGEKPSFRQAFKRGQFCLIPAQSIFEPNYESGKAQRWEIAGADGAPLAIAGIWEVHERKAGSPSLTSFSMLTINADGHPIMQRMHRPQDEKRLVLILRPEDYDGWLHATPEAASRFFTQYPAGQLDAHPASRTNALRDA